MTRRQRAVKVVIGLILVAGLASAYVFYLSSTDHLKNPARLAFILNISKLPDSVRDIECSSNAVTDVVVTCAYRVNSEDFQTLLSGWSFSSNDVSGDGKAYGMDALIGPSFDAATRHLVHPKSFKNGGLVDLVTDRERTMVVANRFEE